RRSVASHEVVNLPRRLVPSRPGVEQQHPLAPSAESQRRRQTARPAPHDHHVVRLVLGGPIRLLHPFDVAPLPHPEESAVFGPIGAPCDRRSPLQPADFSLTGRFRTPLPLTLSPPWVLSAPQFQLSSVGRAGGC